MNPEEAKLYLAASRRSDRRGADERAAKAWDCLGRDGDLANWFDREQECIEALDDKLGQIVPPSSLRSQIFASCGEPHSGRRIRRRPAVLAVAAVLLLSLVGVVLWMNRPVASGEESLAAYRSDMAAFLDRFFVLDYQGDKVSDVTSWLSRKHGLDHFAVPASLAAHPSLGCEVIDWQGKESFLICFDVDGEVVHLFLLPGGKTLDSKALRPVPEFEAIDGKWAACTWLEGEDLYFCCTLAPEALLRECLATRLAPRTSLGHPPSAGREERNRLGLRAGPTPDSPSPGRKPGPRPRLVAPRIATGALSRSEPNPGIDPAPTAPASPLHGVGGSRPFRRQSGELAELIS